jgi:hypothetical protein
LYNSNFAAVFPILRLKLSIDASFYSFTAAFAFVLCCFDRKRMATPQAEPAEAETDEILELELAKKPKPWADYTPAKRLQFALPVCVSIN